MKNKKRGFTLIELMVSIGLFAIVMLLTSGAYLMMISINRQVQGIATGINNLSFALETMTRDIRTGTNYSCNVDVETGAGSDCSGGTSLFVTNANGRGRMTYAYDSTNKSITQNGAALTDPSSVTITSLKFNVSGTGSFSATGDSDRQQPYVTIVITGNVPSGPGKPPQSFTVETSAAMRGTDL